MGVHVELHFVEWEQALLRLGRFRCFVVNDVKRTISNFEYVIGRAAQSYFGFRICPRELGPVKFARGNVARDLTDIRKPVRDTVVMVEIGVNYALGVSVDRTKDAGEWNLKRNSLTTMQAHPIASGAKILQEQRPEGSCR